MSRIRIVDAESGRQVRHRVRTMEEADKAREYYEKQTGRRYRVVKEFCGGGESLTSTCKLYFSRALSTITKDISLADPRTWVKPIAVVLGILGAALVASASIDHQYWGFSCWLAANTLWVYHGIRIQDGWLIILFGIYGITAVSGWWRCL